MEPLHTLVSHSTDLDRLLHEYLPDKTRVLLTNHTFVEIADIYLNDRITCIKKSTGLQTYSGSTKQITPSTIMLRCGQKNIYLHADHYYLFKKHRATRSNNREFFEHLLTTM